MFVSVSNDLSFALWEIIKDKPKFLRRVEIPNKVIKLDFFDKHIFLAKLDRNKQIK